MLGGLPFIWTLLVRPDWAGNVLWNWRESGDTLISDTENNTEFPR